MSVEEPLENIGGAILQKGEIQKLQDLHSLIIGDCKLRTFRTDEGYLLRFLYCTNFNVSQALVRMQHYHNLFLEYPNWFASRSPLEEKEKIERNDKAILNKYDTDGRSILIFKLGNIKTELTSPEEEARLTELWVEYLMDDANTQCNGVCLILDLKGLSWKLFGWITPKNVKIIDKKMDVYPIKNLIIHIVNTSFLLNAAIKIIWPFLSESLKQVIKFHFENWPSLHKYIRDDILPTEYGGTGSDIDYHKSNQCLFNKNNEVKERLKKQSAREV